MNKRTWRACSVEDCPTKSRKLGMCDKHYWRWKRSGTTDAPKKYRRVGLWGKVDKGAPGGCWLWQGSRTAKGYGRYNIGGRTYQAHRFVYEHLVGPIPDGLEIDHLCRVTSCVNPEHLEAVTPEENTRRRYAARR